MSRARLGVGIIGVQPGRSWAARSHVPALRHLADDFDIVGIANRTHDSSRCAANELGLARAFRSVAELIEARDVDIVTVAVRVPFHFELVRAAILAGKHVYCEWPLGNGVAEAEAMTALARDKGIVAVVGTQARVAPEILRVRKLISEGFIGELLSTSMIARGGNGGGTLANSSNAYLLDPRNGATMLTIPIGHTLAAMRDTLGGFKDLWATAATRRPHVKVIDTNETLLNRSPDQIVIGGTLAGGAVASIHYRGGLEADGRGLVWDINGTEGDIRVAGLSGHTQMVALQISGARSGSRKFHRLDAPQSNARNWPEDVAVGNVARLYALMAHDIRRGTRHAPAFGDGLVIHQTLDAIGRSAETGKRIAVEH